MKLRDTQGVTHDFPCPDQKPDWNSQEWITRANNWWNQLVARKLNHPNPEESRATRYRPQWTKQEKNYLESSIKRRIRETKRKPSGEDWEAISQAQNKRFEGQSILPGQAFAINNDKGKGNTGKKNTVAKKKQEIPKRSSEAIQGVIRKWPNTIAIIDDLLDEVGYYRSDQSDDEGAESGNEKEKGYTAEDNGSSDDTITGINRSFPGDSDDELGGGMDQTGIASGLPITA
jgi:hypothetical protein